MTAISCVSGLFWALCYYPWADSWLPGLLLGYGALLCWRADLWLLALPALLPVIDFAPESGWFFVEELDLLLLLTAAVTYWRLEPDAVLPRYTHFSRISLLGLALAVSIALWRGLAPLLPPDLNSFNNYLSPYYALRIAKAWGWGYLLLPPLRQTIGPELVGLRRRLLPGMLIGLASVCWAAIRERVEFPGLLNFSSDYRITAPFSAMHTGGAALDGYLALSIPLLVVWLCTKNMPQRTAALVLLTAALYTALATFSRGLYLALASTALLLLGLPCSGLLGPTLQQNLGRLTAVTLILSLVYGVVLGLVFDSSGYRGLAAGLVLVVAALLLSTYAVRAPVLATALICGVAAFAVLLWLVPDSESAVFFLKPQYLLFLCAGTMVAAGSYFVPRYLPLAIMGWAGLALTTLVIAYRQVGAASYMSSAALLLAALLPITVSLIQEAPLWRLNGLRLSALSLAVLVLALVIPIGQSYFVSVRFANSSSDLCARLRHWQQVIDLMPDDGWTSLVGMGLGKFPATYFWRNPQQELPSAYTYRESLGNRYLRLSSGTYAAGYGERLRIMQRVQPKVETAYVLAIDVWNDGRPAWLHVDLCERQLLYAQACLGLPPRAVPVSASWQRHQWTVSSGQLGGDHRPVRLEFSVDGQQAALNLDNIRMYEQSTGRELLRNGGFSTTNDYWFFTSDHHHLPWHIKNLVLNLFFEMGLLGCLAYGGLLIAAVTTLWQRSRDDSDAVLPLALLAALIAFHVVGWFDSLLDVPRVTIIVMLLMHAAALQAVDTAASPGGASC